MSDEEKYRELRAKLRATPKVKAKSDFDNKLYARLREVESNRMSPSVERLTRPSREKGWIFSLLRPAFVPAAGLTVIVLIGLIWFLAYNPMQTNKNEQVSTTQDSPQQPSVNTEQPKEEGKQTEERNESPITSNDRILKETGQLPPRIMTKESSPGPEKVNSDFNVYRPTEETESKTDVEQTIIRATPKIDVEKKAEEKIDDGIRRIEKKEAPANIRKNEGDIKNKNTDEEIDQQKGNEGILKEIIPSIKEKTLDTDKSKDSAKQKETKKKTGKLSNDSLNQQKQKTEENKDSIKKSDK